MEISVCFVTAQLLTRTEPLKVLLQAFQVVSSTTIRALALQTLTRLVQKSGAQVKVTLIALRLFSVVNGSTNPFASSQFSASTWKFVRRCLE